MFELFLPGPPIPLARPRLHGKGLYDPQFAEKNALQDYTRKNVKKPFEGALHLDLVFQMPIPMSFSKTKKLNLPAYTKRPDLSNLVKFIEDALNGVLWHDDAQIISFNARKCYHNDVGVLLTVRTLDGQLEKP